MTHSSIGRRSRTKTAAIAPAIPRSIVGILRAKLPTAMIGTPVKIQPAANHGTLQNKTSKEIAGFRTCKPVAIPHTNHEAANATKESLMRVVSVTVAIKRSQKRWRY
jgi:hypothetical protein